MRPTFDMSVCAVALLFSPTSTAQERDPWLGADKALHFGASGALAMGGYGVGLALFDREPPRLALGAGVALSLGIAKELYDLGGNGDASWRDLAWNVAGAAVGLAVAWAVDRFILQRLGVHRHGIRSLRPS